MHLILVACPIGTHWSDGVCKLCPIGTYQNETGQQLCEDCPKGCTTLYKASKNENDCFGKYPIRPKGNENSELYRKKDLMYTQ